MGDYGVPQKSCRYRLMVYAEEPIKKSYVFTTPESLPDTKAFEEFGSGG